MLPTVQLNNKEKNRLRCREWYAQNREKSLAQGKAWYRAHKAIVKQRSRDGELRRNFGLTRAEYNRLWQIQGGMCAICKIHQLNINKNLRVDHCHKTKRIRGLLCHNCNVSLGLMKESIESLKAMILYLEQI